MSSPIPSSPLLRPTPLGNKRSLWTGAPVSSGKKRKVFSSSSSDAPDTVDAVLFKKPCLPARLTSNLHAAPRTPSSSSTAGTERMSSSPFPDLPSSPTRLSSHALILETRPILITMPTDTALIFGRSRHFRSALPTKPASSTGPAPPSLTRYLESPLVPTKCISLPRSATHASRLHAAIEYSPKRDVLRVIVLGQNGCKLSGSLCFATASGDAARKTKKMKRVRVGDVVELERPIDPVQSELEIDFYGSKVMVTWPQAPHHERAKPQVQTAPLVVPSSPISDLPSDASSDSDSSDEDDAAKDYEIALESDVASDLSPIPSSPAALCLSSPPRPVSDLPTDNKLPIVLEKVEQVEDKPAEPTPLVPSTVDIPALLASTVVFSGSSATSLPDLVKGLLDSQPALRAHAPEATWRTWSADVLESDAMFGKVQRNGKDSSGHPLLPLFYYIPANDPDRARANELGSLVRPLRSVQRGGGKAIDWRPVGSGRRRYY